MDKNNLKADEHLTDEANSVEQRKDYKLEEIESEEKFTNSLKLDLSDDEKQTIATDIISLADEFEVSRKEWTDQWQIVRQYYEDELPEHTFPWEGCCQYHDPMILKSVNSIESRISQVIFGTGERRVWTFKPTEKSDIETNRRKEKYIDYVTVVEMKLEEVFNGVSHDAVLLGNGFMALTWLKNEQRVKDVEIYDPSQDNEVLLRNADPERDEELDLELSAMDTFLKNYPDAQEKYPEEYAKIARGERVELKVNYNDLVYNAPKAERVKPEDMIADRRIIEPERQTLYGRWKYFTRNELLQLKEQGFFENVDEVLTELKQDTDKDGKTFTKPDTKLYQVAEVIYRHNNVKNKTGQPGMNLFWIFKDKKVYLRGVSYIYDHMKPFIVPFYIEDKGDEFYRKGVGVRLLGVNDVEDTLIRQAVDSNTIANVPCFTSDDPDFRPQTIKFYPGATLPKGLQQVKITGGNAVQYSIELGQLIARKADDIPSVSSLLTGKESPTDPTAPASKTAMLIRESGINIAKGIKSIKLAMREVGFQISELEYQFGDKKKQFRVIGSVAFEEITADDMRIRGDFVPAGSLEYADPNIVFQKDKFLYEEGKQNPIVQSNPVIQAELWRNLVISAGDLWEMQVDKLAPTPLESMDMMADFQEKQQEKKLEIGKRIARKQGRLRGKTPEEIEIMLDGLFNQNPAEQPMTPQEGVIPNDTEPAPGNPGNPA